MNGNFESGELYRERKPKLQIFWGLDRQGEKSAQQSKRHHALGNGITQYPRGGGLEIGHRARKIFTHREEEKFQNTASMTGDRSGQRAASGGTRGKEKQTGGE